MKVAIIIINYRTPDLVIDCLQSLKFEISKGTPFQVFIGDADSCDESVEKISRFIKEERLNWAKCIPIGVNLGFAYGNNFLLKRFALPDFDFTHVYFLNPDTYIHHGAVSALLDFLVSNQSAGVAGSRLENPDGSQRAGLFRFPTPWREFFRGASLSIFDSLVPSSRGLLPGGLSPMRTDWVSGASFMIPRWVLDRVGLLDEGYFLYFEETDLMKRIAAAGLEIWHVPQSRIVHLAGQATGHRFGDRPQRISPHWLLSRARYFGRHHGRMGLITGSILFLAGDLLYRLSCLVRLKKPNRSPLMWRDYMRFGFSTSAERLPNGRG